MSGKAWTIAVIPVHCETGWHEVAGWRWEGGFDLDWRAGGCGAKDCSRNGVFAITHLRSGRALFGVEVLLGEAQAIVEDMSAALPWLAHFTVEQALNDREREADFRRFMASVEGFSLAKSPPAPIAAVGHKRATVQ